MKKLFSISVVILFIFFPAPPPSPIPTPWRVSHVVRRNVVFERIKLLVKINFDRLHKLLLCLKISRLENNAAHDGVCVVLYSVDIEKGGEKGGKKRKKKGHEDWHVSTSGCHGCLATSCAEFPRQPEVVSALYTNCVIYIPQLGMLPRPLFLAKIFFITPYVSVEKERNHSRKIKFVATACSP